MNEINFYSEDVEKILDAFKFGFVVEILMSFIIGAILFKLVDVFDDKLKENLDTSRSNSPLTRFIPILSKVLKGLVVFFLLATFLQSHGYSMSSLIAGFGITGLAVGFAAKETIANIFGTLGILSDHSYEIGDYIEVNKSEGIVEDINMRSTKIRGLDNSLIILPNNMVAAAVIKNISAANKRRIFESIGITYGTCNEKIQKAVCIIEEILDNNDMIYDDFVVYLETLADSAIRIKMNAYVKTNNYPEFLKVRSAIIIDIVKRYRAEDIEFAFPSRTVYLENK